MKERFGATDPRSMMIRFHTQTGGVTLTAQQPLNNVVRVALQAFAAVCGGTQSLHTNGYDEALALPTERAAKLALRTQQIVAHESGAADTVDPFAGSYFVEALTAEIEQRARTLIARVDELGGSVAAIAFIKNEIEESAFGYHERYRTGQDIVVGVNKYVEEEAEVEEILRVDPEAERAQVERLRAFKAARDQELADRRLDELRAACRGDENLLPPIRAGARATAARWARCAARCATCSATTSRPHVERRTITFYSFVVFVHVAAVVIAFGGLFALPLLLGRGQRGRRPPADALRRGRRPGRPVVLAAGLYLALDGPYEFGDPWIGTTLLILIVVMGIVGAYLIPRARRLAAGDDDAARAARSSSAASWSPTLLVLLAIFLMVTKPGA